MAEVAAKENVRKEIMPEDLDMARKNLAGTFHGEIAGKTVEAIVSFCQRKKAWERVPIKYLIDHLGLPREYSSRKVLKDAFIQLKVRGKSLVEFFKTSEEVEVTGEGKCFLYDHFQAREKPRRRPEGKRNRYKKF